ncbi:MAG: LacI family transcriptional regulator [Bryobacteraceae bacterium]|nr:LacI family transcriptional regulator [Bryobacteraceae bacterium]MDW8376866.1 LacI family DNA-binding transcriptional regulator [Bryobacterales bacterium]
MATIYDVARRAKVSTYTVSAVLNQSAKVSPQLTARVLKAARDLNYTINHIARSLQTRRTMTIGMLIPDIANPWLGLVVRGVEDVCSKRGYSLFLGNTYGDISKQSDYLRVFRSRQVDGVILFMAANSERELAPLLEAKTPLVFAGRRPRRLDADSVTADNHLGTKLAVNHLISHGRRRIAILVGESTLSTSRDRVAGWRASHRTAGLSIDSSLVSYGEWTTASACTRTLEIMRRRHPPDAIFASSFPLLIGVLDALRQLGLRHPQDIEVMSSDDSRLLDVFEPRISVVEQPSYELGAEAARLLLERIEQPSLPSRQIVLKPALKLRD